MRSNPTHLDWTARLDWVRESIPQIMTFVHRHWPTAAREALQDSADRLPDGSRARAHAEQLVRRLLVGAAVSLDDVRLLREYVEDLTDQLHTTAPGDDLAVPSLTGIPVEVYRSADGLDCTRGGVTSHHTRLILVGTLDEFSTFSPSPESARLWAPTDSTPAVALRAGNRGSVHLVPVDDTGQPLGRRWYMAGGNFAATSDSRLSDYLRQIRREPLYAAISVHDRTED